jgi:prepilin-type N-terminal cleavage/methylation domain-containing protein
MHYLGPTARRRGVTLVELLVVLSILALLMGLLLPAVQRARESANRTACANNLHQIGLAMHQYHLVHGTLPSFSKDGDDATTWCVLILPFLEQDNLYRQWNFSRSYYEQSDEARLTRVPNYFCPTRRTPSTPPLASRSGDQRFNQDDLHPSTYPNVPGALGDYAANMGSHGFG